MTLLTTATVLGLGVAAVCSSSNMLLNSSVCLHQGHNVVININMKLFIVPRPLPIFNVKLHATLKNLEWPGDEVREYRLHREHTPSSYEYVDHYNY